MQQSRRMLVLRAIVEEYIKSQEPVGSTTLSRDHDLSVSSATIRNDMAALEDDGYIIQPHTSAGRIPTEKGYRYFVDRLATVVPLSQAQRRGIRNFLSGSVSIEDVLQRAARLLANITGQVAVVASPALSKASLRHIEIVPVASNVLLAVVITDTGSVAQHTLQVRNEPTPEQIERFCAELNVRADGQSLTRAADLATTLVQDAKDPVLADVSHALRRALKNMADDEQAGQLYMYGTSRLAHQRTVSDLAPLFDALDEQVVIMKLMSALSEEASEAGVGIAIGSETHTPGLLHAAVVSGGYGRSSTAVPAASDTTDATGSQLVEETSDWQTPVAFVGSIGPTHMDYATTMAAVRAVARYLTGFISNETDQG